MSPSIHAQHRPLVSVVTPVRNAEAMIEDTVQSVVSQSAVTSGRARLQYLVADGASTDETVERAKRAGGAAIEIRSEADHGMYDALANAWTRGWADADVVAYLNAGDIWIPGALDVILDVMTSIDTAWVSGQRAAMNVHGQITSIDLPYRYRRRLIRSAAYLGPLPHIQQESTFWSGHLMSLVNLDRLGSLRLAGDHYLWTCLSQIQEPTVVEALLGAFRVHPGQQSSDVSAYQQEGRELSRPSQVVDRLLVASDWVAWQLPAPVKARLNGRHLVRYNYEAGRWMSHRGRTRSRIRC